jgi:hypothetical protein
MYLMSIVGSDVCLKNWQLLHWYIIEVVYIDVPGMNWRHRHMYDV